MNDCLFCSIIAGDIPSYRIYEDDTCYAFLDIGPWHRGHTLVVPKEHVADGTTDPSAWTHVGAGITTVSTLLKDKLGATGVNILANCGASAGQEVFHFHVHVIPRYDDNPGMSGLMVRDDHAADDLEGLQKLLVG